MRICDKPPFFLTYCLNVHSGESWDENFEAIRTHAVEVRNRVSGGKAFGLGLRLGADAAVELADPRRVGATRTSMSPPPTRSRRRNSRSATIQTYSGSLRRSSLTLLAISSREVSGK